MSDDEFNSWLTNLCQANKLSFVKRTSDKTRIYFNCSHSALKIKRTICSKKAPVSYGSKKGNKCCPTYLVKTKTQFGIKVTGFYGIHSHGTELTFTFLPSFIRRYIKTLLSQKHTHQIILQKTKERFPKYYITSKQIYNIAYSHLQNFLYDKNDITSSGIFIQKNQEHFLMTKFPTQSDNETVLIFTPGIEEEIEGSSIYQLDSTHCTTQYGFYLTTLLTLDSRNHGIPILQMISSNEKQNTIHKFLSIAKEKLNIPKQHTVITDDYTVYCSEWEKIFFEHDFEHILCRWHVKKNLKKSFNRLMQSEKNQISKLILSLLKTRSVDLYNSTVREIQRNCSNEEYLRYIHETYLKRKEKWCPAFIKAKIYFNLHIESYHRILKKDYFGYRRNKRVDILLSVLFSLTKDKRIENRRKDLKKSYTNSHQKFYKYHHMMVKNSPAVHYSHGIITVQVICSFKINYKET